MGIFNRKPATPAPEPRYTADTRSQYQAALASGDRAAAKRIERDVIGNGTKAERLDLQDDFQKGYRPGKRRT